MSEIASEPAVVTSASPFTIRYDTGVKDLPALHLGAYTPVVADRVAVVRLGVRLLCLGKVV